MALLAGAVLRLWNLDDQILMGDELHGVRSALDWDLGRILTTYRLADNSIPLTAFYRLLLESGAAPSELYFRLPSVVTGLALLVALPGLAGRELGARVATHAVWLAALSPSLVYYSRIARPYAVMTFLCVVAVAAFWWWWERGGGWGWALAYCAAGAGAAWFHLGSAPFVAAPLAFAAVDVGWRLATRAGDGAVRLRRLLAAAAVFLALVACFLLPAGATFVRLLRARSGDGSSTVESVFGSLMLQAGSARPWLAVLFWTAALAGWALLLRERSRLALYGACAVAVQWAAIAWILQPTGLAHAIVLNRYLLPTLPVVLVAVGHGLDGATRWLGRHGRGSVGGWVPALFVLALLLGGPYAEDPGLHLGSFAGSNQALNFLAPVTTAPEAGVPSVYRTIAREPGREAVLEAPRDTAWWRNEAPVAYARVHGRRVVIGSTDPRLDDPRLRLRNMVPIDPPSLAGSGARFVVVDLDPAALTTRLGRGDGRGSGPRSRPKGAVAAELARRLETEWGEPTMIDGSLRVWDLAKVRWRRR